MYAALISLRIFWPFYTGQAIIGVLIGLASLAAVVLERLSRGSKKRYLLARILAAASLVIGLFNAFS